MQLYRPNSNIVLSGGITLAIIIACIIIFDFKITGISTYTNQTAESKKNDYLAASMFIAAQNDIEFVQQNAQQIKQKVEVQPSLNLLNNLPDVTDSIIITTSRQSTTYSQTYELLDWVERGGNLIVEYKFSWFTDDTPDKLMQELDISVKKYEEELREIRNKVASTIESEAQEEKPEQDAESFSIKQQGHFLRCPIADKNIIEFPSETQFPLASARLSSGSNLIIGEKSPRLTLSNDKGIQLVQLSIEKGTVTVITDLSIWHNNRIHCFDHAFLLHKLTTDNQRQGKVWFLTRERFPSFFDMLQDKHLALSVSALLLLLCWIWSQTLRYGPVHPISRNQRREYIEHLTASARYQANSGQNEQLIAGLRQNIIHRIKLRYSGFDQLTKQQQLEQLVKWTNMSLEAIDIALYQDAAKAPSDLLNQIQMAQQLRKHLC